MPNKAKVEAITHYKTELLRIVHKLSSTTRRSGTQTHMDDLYNLLIRIQNYCAVFQIKAVKTITTFLISKMNVTAETVGIKPGEERLFMDGLRTLMKELSDYPDPSRRHLRKRSSNETSESQNVVLIYDKDQLFLEWLKDEVYETSYQFVEMTDTNFKEELFIHDPSIILICIEKGNNEDKELVSYVRNHYSKSIPIIAYSQSNDTDHLQGILDLNVTHILTKPFNSSLLISYMDNALTNIKNTVPIMGYSSNDFKLQRNAMKNLIKKEWLKFQRYQALFSLVLIKVDTYQYFINQYQRKYYQLLNQLKLTVSNTTRPYDEISIWSPGAIMLLLPVTPLEGAETVVQRINHLIKESGHRLSEHISFGIIESEMSYLTDERLIEKLEEEMGKSFSLTAPVIVPRSDRVSNDVNVERSKVLLIDDDLVSSTILFNNLDDEQWEVEVCNDGADALEHALQFEPDVILCETKLKDLDGYSFCLQVKQIPKLTNTIFCFLSEQQLKQFIVRAFNIGADDYFLKPFYIEELEVRLKRHIKVRVSDQR